MRKPKLLKNLIKNSLPLKSQKGLVATIVRSKSMQQIQSCNGRADKGKTREKSGVSRRVISQIKREINRNPLRTSKQVFEAVGMVNVPKSTRCLILQRIAKCKKPLVRPPLKQVHREKRLEWAKKYLKQNFEFVLFTDEYRATLDGPDGWARGWCDAKALCPQRIRRQQGGGGVMFWAAIIHDKLVGPFRVKDGVKMTAPTYIAFLKEHFSPWYKKQSLAFRNKMVFMQDNAPSHAAHLTTDFLKKVLVKKGEIMEWPACSPDLNPIENLWSILKREVYAGGKQYSSKEDLWNAIKITANGISSNTIKKLTSSMDQRLLSVVSNHGRYIKY